MHPRRQGLLRCEARGAPARLEGVAKDAVREVPLFLRRARLLEHNRRAVHVIDPVSASLRLRFKSAENVVRRFAARDLVEPDANAPAPPRDTKVFASGVLEKRLRGHIFGSRPTGHAPGALQSARPTAKTPPPTPQGPNRLQQAPKSCFHCCSLLAEALPLNGVPFRNDLELARLQHMPVLLAVSCVRCRRHNSVRVTSAA